MGEKLGALSEKNKNEKEKQSDGLKTDKIPEPPETDIYFCNDTIKRKTNQDKNIIKLYFSGLGWKMSMNHARADPMIL